MSTGTYVPVACAGCGKPITDPSFTWTGTGMFHKHCVPPSNFTFAPPFGGLPLTEDRVRQIVREELQRALGVPPTVLVNRPATMEEAQHAAQIGACVPNGVMFDAFGRQRVRYVRVIHDGTTCVVPPGDVADLVDSERPGDYRTEDVYLSEEEFDALPEFDGF